MSAAGPPQGANSAPSGGSEHRERGGTPTSVARDAVVSIYTDGACKGNPGPGGWGALLVFRGREKELYGGDPATTNNRMELTAVIRAFEALQQGCVVALHTDSQYVKNGIETWIHSWKKNGWKTADRKPVKNAELWRELDALVGRHDVKWHWVKGHNGHPGNERADALANRGVEAIMAPGIGHAG